MPISDDFSLPQLGEQDPDYAGGSIRDAPTTPKSAADLEQLFDVPVMVSAVLGREDPPALLVASTSDPAQFRALLDTVGDRRVLDVLVLDAAVAPYGVPETPEKSGSAATTQTSETSQTPQHPGAGFTVWLCRDGRCELPVHGPQEVARLLG